ncbi:stress protein [Enterovibrio norvegicus]|uniref:Dabb family protein n=1 Tax=Enterovibrio norvegicus TaxID=188144 RepID=UPI000C851DAE|nr:Dabb family protein [Enterovibrio norvegicus]MCC4798694.1 Dabb family protein [Enterovibrio norvegicus]PMH67864.1 stress protein [Enterovibrio norvegicus]PMI28819.1 stress protein [Enterovibrio norvegicus]PMI36852.1 stress protein [Enterovibrio norvegicus]PMN47470.1 stress protein [Enterovibrio norvegicus]
MIRHILLVTFKPTTNEADLGEIREEFESMTERVEGVVSVEWGENDSPEGKNKGYTHIIFMTFNDEDARQRYLVDPEHDGLKVVFGPHIEDLIVVDYTL